jgi:acyl-coenzyme A synthetase/AMP-(fatty) acid ligase
MKLVPIAQLLNGGRSDDHGVAWSHGQQITLGRLRVDIAHNAARIAQGRVRRALLACEDSYWFVVGLLALLRIGVNVILPPNSRIGVLQALRDEFDLLVTDSGAPEISPALTLEAGIAGAAPIDLDAAASRIDFFTSGSTGEMKRIGKTLALFEREAAALESLWGEELATARIYCMVPHQHVFGMTFGLIWPLLAGRGFSAKIHSVWETVFEEFRPPGALVSSPAHLTRLGGFPELSAGARPRMIFTAGAPLPRPAAAESARILGPIPVEIFGSTETGAIAWFQGLSATPLWRPLPGVEVSSGESGLLRLRSRFVAGEGWCELADHVSVARDGRFKFEGRADQVAKIEGKRISVRQVERAIAALPWIEEAAVATVTTHRTFLGVVATLSATGQAECDRLGKFRFARMLRRELGRSHEAAALPRRWRFVDRMPADDLGKRRNRDVIALLEGIA